MGAREVPEGLRGFLGEYQEILRRFQGVPEAFDGCHMVTWGFREIWAAPGDFRGVSVGLRGSQGYFKRNQEGALQGISRAFQGVLGCSRDLRALRSSQQYLRGA